MFLTVGVSCINASETNQKNNDEVFIVGIGPEFPPFEFKDDNGEYTGFDIDLAREVAERNNWTFVVQPLSSWDSKDTELNSGTVDCIWSELSIDGREDDYTWSEAYFNNSQVVVVKADSGISKLDDLAGKNVEVEEGNSVLNILEGDKKSLTDSFASLTKINDYNTGFTDLKSGVCDAVIVDIGSAKYQIKKNNQDDELIILDDVISHEKYGIGFKKGNENLRNQVQETLNQMFEDGTVDEIAQKYQDYGIPEGLLKP